MTKCKKCMYWDKFERNPEKGRCRRYAPGTVRKILIQTCMVFETIDTHTYADWQVTREDDWCGDFRMDMGKRILDEMEKSE